MYDSCIKNVICRITTNLDFDLYKMVCYFGGQYTKKLPALRIPFVLNFNSATDKDSSSSPPSSSKNLILDSDGDRYSVLIYKSGQIVITNVYYLDDINALFAFFNSFILFSFKKGFCFLKKNTNSLSKHFYIYNKYKEMSNEKIFISYLVENFHFAIQLDPTKEKTNFEKVVDSFNLEYGENTLKNIIKPQDYVDESFPAEISKYNCKRNPETNNLKKYKSLASIKRHTKYDFLYQTISVHAFGNGKMIITGCQTKSDMFNIFSFIKKIVSC